MVACKIVGLLASFGTGSWNSDIRGNWCRVGEAALGGREAGGEWGTLWELDTRETLVCITWSIIYSVIKKKARKKPTQTSVFSSLKWNLVQWCFEP